MTIGQGALRGRAVVVLLVVLCRAAYANDYENIPTGARTAALGGAGIAGGSDSAMPTLNPAGLALIPGSVASISASLYQVSALNVPNFIADGSSVMSRWGALQVSDTGVRSVQFNTFPSGLAYFLHLGTSESPTVLAASLSVPRSINRQFVTNVQYLGHGVSVQDNITRVETEQSYVGAVSFAQGFGDLRIGASILASYTQRLVTSDTSELQVLGSAQFARAQDKFSASGDSGDLGVVAGLQYNVTRALKIGASFRPPSIHAFGSLTTTADATSLDNVSPPIVSTSKINGDFRRGLPLKAGVGLEYTGDGWGIAADGVLFVPLSSTFQTSGTLVSSDIGGTISIPDYQRSLTTSIETKSTANFALGFEYHLSETNRLRLGAFTDFSAIKTPDRAAIATGGAPTLGIFAIQAFGGTAGWGTLVGPIDTTIGIRGSYGNGSTVRISPNTKFSGHEVVEDTTAQEAQFLAFISAALDISGAGDLVKGVKNAAQEEK